GDPLTIGVAEVQMAHRVVVRGRLRHRGGAGGSRGRLQARGRRKVRAEVTAASARGAADAAARGARAAAAGGGGDPARGAREARAAPAAAARATASVVAGSDRASATGDEGGRVEGDRSGEERKGSDARRSHGLSIPQRAGRHRPSERNPSASTNSRRTRRSRPAARAILATFSGGAITAVVS